MGVIQRQSIKQSLVNYIGVGIAAISTFFIYSEDKATYGLARFIIDTSMILAPFIMLGFSSVTIRFFPHFKKEEQGHRGFLFMLLLALLVGSILFIILAFLFKDQFYNIFAEKPEIYRQFLPYLVPISILMAFIQLFYSYSSNFKRIAIPAIFLSLIKISLPVLILLFIWQSIAIDRLVDGILLNYILALAGLVLYVRWLGQLKLKPDFSLMTKSTMKEIRGFAIYSLFSSLGSMLAFRIDLFMVPTLLSFQDNGVYAIALFIGNAIAIPTGAIGQISGPIVTEAIENNNLAKVKKIYQSSSINLLVVGLLFFICIIASVEDLFAIMPKGEQMEGGLMIVFLIGMAKIIDMGTSINNEIINYSKYFRFSFYAIILMAILNIVSNLILIPKYQIVGAAAATLLSLTVYNLVKLVFIQWRFKMQPFTIKSLWVLLIAGFAYLAGLLVPSTGIIILDILIRSLFICSLYIGIVLYFNISQEFGDLLKRMIQKIRPR